MSVSTKAKQLPSRKIEPSVRMSTMISMNKIRQKNRQYYNNP